MNPTTERLLREIFLKRLSSGNDFGVHVEDDPELTGEVVGTMTQLVVDSARGKWELQYGTLKWSTEDSETSRFSLGIEGSIEEPHYYIHASLPGASTAGEFEPAFAGGHEAWLHAITIKLTPSMEQLRPLWEALERTGLLQDLFDKTYLEQSQFPLRFSESLARFRGRFLPSS